MDRNNARHHLEPLEPRELLTAVPSAVFMNYVKGAGDSRTFAVLYQGPAPILRSSIGADDIVLTRQDGKAFAVTPVGIARAKAGAPTLVRYRVDGIADPGLYTIRVREGAVADTTGVAVPADPIGLFKLAGDGRAFPIPLPPATPPQPPQPPTQSAIKILGNTFGNASNPPTRLDAFGPVVEALNFGGYDSALAGSGGTVFLNASPAVSDTPPFLTVSPYFVSVAADDFSPLADAIVGPDPTYETEIFSTTQTSMSLRVSGLDPAKQYRFQFLHGDTRGGLPYINSTQGFATGDAKYVSIPLTFNSSPSDAFADTTVVISGTNELNYYMAFSPNRGPSFSAMIIEEADFPAPPTPPTPPSPPPAAPASATFVRGSVRLVQSGQTFDIAYADPNVVSTTQVAAADFVTVTGPRGFAARALLTGAVTAPDGRGLIATYRIEGVDVTGRHTIAVNDQPIASTTLFYLKPIIWDLPPDDSGGNDSPLASAGDDVLRRSVTPHHHRRHRHHH